MFTKNEELAHRRFQRAEENRRFEIELLWKRSTFFWGFLIAAFAAYAATLEKSGMVALLVACFGVMASFVWYLANRAGAFWQDVWESNLDEDEEVAIGKRVYRRAPAGKPASILRPQRFSLGVLASGFSLFTFFLWLALLAISLIRILAPSPTGCVYPLTKAASIFVVTSTLVSLVLIHSLSRKHRKPLVKVELQPTAKSDAPSVDSAERSS